MKEKSSKVNSNIKSKQQKKERIILIVSSLMFILSIIYTFCPFSFSWLNTPFSESEQQELFFNLFTIQATIAVLSVSIIAIITGFQTENVYGVTVTNYITSLKPCLFTHKRLMIFDLVITGINYFFVSLKWYNLSIVLFVISIIISCVLIWDTAFIFKSRSKISEEIGEYLRENICIDYLEELESSLNKKATIENVAGVEEDLSFLNTLYSDEIKIEKYSKDILQKIEKILSNLFINSYLSTNKNMVLSILGAIDKIYQVTNDSKKPYLLNIWSDIYIEYLSFVSTISIFQLKDHNRFDVFKFKRNIERNQDLIIENGIVKERNNFYIEYYYSWIYKYIILKNQLGFEKEDCENLKKRIYHNAYHDAISSQDSYKLSVKRIRGFCYLNKMLIENEDIVFLEKTYFRNYKYSLEKAENTFIYIINIIYSVYLAYQEPLVIGTGEQKNAELYLKTVREHGLHDSIYFLGIVEMLEKYYNEFFSMLVHWEKFIEGEAKTVVLEPAVKDFLFFICIEKYYDEETLAKCFQIISNNNVECLLINYFSDENKFIDRYKGFYKRLYDEELSEQNMLSVQSLVRGALAREYKSELLESAEEHCIKDNTIEKYKEKLDEFIKSELEKFNIFNNEIEDYQTTSELINLDIVDFEELNSDNLGNMIETLSLINLYSVFIRRIFKNIIMKEINYSNKNKQNTLIELSRGFDPDTFIGCRETFWDEDDKNQLRRYTENMKKIKDKYDGNHLYLINSSLIHFSVTNIQYHFTDCTIDDFERLGIKADNDKYYYSRFNSTLKAEFTKEEMLEHLRKTMKHLKITADINYAVKKEKIGCGIEIIYGNLDEENDKQEDETNDDTKNS